MVENTIIQSLWIGDRLSTMEQLCIASFLYHGHDFHLYTYGDVKDIPEGTVIKDANEIVPADKIFKYKDHNSYAGFSNVFRYKLLLDKGGYWVDTDNVCLQTFAGDKEYIFSSQRPVKSDKIQETNCGVIKVPPGSEIMRFCYDTAISKDPKKLQWGEIGPKLLEKAVMKYGLESYIEPPEVFCEIDFWKWYKFIGGSIDLTQYKKTKSLHLWNEMWRRNGVDKDMQFVQNSLYEIFKEKYLNYQYDETLDTYEWKKKPSRKPSIIIKVKNTLLKIKRKF